VGGNVKCNIADAASSPPPTSKLTSSGRLLGFVRKLIDYGRQLSTALVQRTAAIAAITRDFGTKDIALILQRIRCGLERANALETRIIHEAASLDAPPGRAGRAAAASPRPPPAAPRPPAPRPPAEPPHPALARLPSAEEIAAEIRSRPIGAVIADICRDLGITPTHPLWQELSFHIVWHGGNFVALLKDTMDRVLPVPRLDPPGAPPPLLAPAATGPP
jgi:hypothetical protein